MLICFSHAQDEDSEEEKPPEDKDDGEFDPSEDVLAEDDDMDFQIEEIKSPWSKRQRTPAAKKPVKRLVPADNSISGKEACPLPPDLPSLS